MSICTSSGKGMLIDALILPRLRGSGYPAGNSMKLKECLERVVLKQIVGDSDCKITGIETNSHNVKMGYLFIALRGHSVDGHQFISQAIKNGAVAVLVEEVLEGAGDATWIIVPDTRKAMAVVASTFYGYPTKELSLIGVTGTNGKTTTTHMIDNILSSIGKRTGLIGTMNMKIGSVSYPVKNTTPDSLELQKSFRMMRDADCDYAVIEVSSHGLHMGRTWGSHFDIGVFTNLTQDHLDYHQTMENYRAAKGLLFSQLSFESFSVLNADDPTSMHYSAITSSQVITYGIHQKADVWAENLITTSRGTTFTLHTFKGSIKVTLKLLGIFNVYNALAAMTTALLKGVSLHEVKEGIEGLVGVRGRLETVDEGQPYTVIVDYAHTPDSLENVLKTIREFVQGRIICVVGCGGDRDRLKRPMMAQVATRYSDITIFTADNPRTEDSNMIVLDMVEGVKNIDSEYHCIVERRDAVQYAIDHAQENDVVLIAGKGHETYQEINGTRYVFDDCEVARSIIKQKNGENDATHV